MGLASRIGVLGRAISHRAQELGQLGRELETIRGELGVPFAPFSKRFWKEALYLLP